MVDAPSGPPSPKDPRLWYALMSEAVAGLQRGDDRSAWIYYRFVKQHRGEGVAREARETIKGYARHPAFLPKVAPVKTYTPKPRTPSPFARR